jgi:hypothetical protein
MSTANSALRVTELDFVSIKENLKTFLRSQTEFQDYDFEGSGMSVLLDILAYNTHYMGYYLNMTANEMFLDTAQLRNSIVSHAKHIGYIPTSRRSSVANVTITVTPSTTEDQNVAALTLDRYTKFIGQELNGVNYTFSALNSNTVFKIGNSFTFEDVILIQGEPTTLQYEVDNTANPKRRYKIPSANVDTSTVVITVQESSSNTYVSEYKLSNDITEITSNSEIFFIEENEDLNYTFYFGDDVIGKKPKDGNIIICNYIDSVGSSGNNISSFTTISSIGNLFRDNVIISSATSSYGGTDKETIEQIRFRAPYAYNAQNRAVTSIDYATLITKDYTNIDSVSVWGGENNVPPVYGKVFLSLKTKTNFFLSNIEKEAIKADLIRNRNVLTVIPEIIDPEYTYLIISGSVTYNPSLTSRSSGEILSLVRAAVLDYQSDELNRFDSTFRKSKLQSYIEASEKSITGSDIKVYLQKRVLLEPQFTKRYVIETNFEIKKGDYNNRLYTYPQVTVLDSGNISRDVFFEEIPSAFTGIDSIQITEPGVNYSSAPTVTINGDGAGATAVAKITAGKITSITLTNKGANYTRASVIISGGNGTGAAAIAKLEYKFGKLRTFYTNTNGEKVIVNNNAGDIDYETGLITINSLATGGTVDNNFYGNNILTINLPIDKDIIATERNQIVNIDDLDSRSIQIDVVVE